MLSRWHVVYHQELFSLEKLTESADKLNNIFHFKVRLKRRSPDVSGWDEPGSRWLPRYGGKGVSDRPCDVADNTQHHIIKDSKHTTVMHS